jgi:hypothetical protein
LNESNGKRRAEYEFVGIVSLFEREDLPFKSEPILELETQKVRLVE